MKGVADSIFNGAASCFRSSPLECRALPNGNTSPLYFALLVKTAITGPYMVHHMYLVYIVS